MRIVTLELSDELYAYAERLAEEGGVDVQEAVRRLIAAAHFASVARQIRLKYSTTPLPPGMETEEAYFASL